MISESVNEPRARLAALVAAQIVNTPFEFTPQDMDPDMDPLSQTIEKQVEKQIESELRDYEAAIRTHLEHSFEKTREYAETNLSNLVELGKLDEEQCNWAFA